jgi:2-amino-4-hydroxy-6-hydroxymethyldihydropteridine diphosphokinase
MNEVGIGMGSNLGNRLEILRQAISALTELSGDEFRISSVYESKAWGYDSENSYYNMVIVFRTNLSADELLDSLLEIEQRLGRVRIDKSYSDRSIDLDLLFYGDLIRHDEYLILPHPRMSLRRFVLEPLKEIHSSWNHPQNGISIVDLVNECEDSPIVRLPVSVRV